AIGTDTGGSVRLPASWCGLSGLKTTIGRVSTYGILPLAPSLDTPGPMARSVEDAALLYTVMQGSDPLDPRTLSAPPPSDPMPAFPVESVDQTTTPAHFTRFVNLLELCALSAPDGFTRTGLPLSLQIICRPYDEAMALRIGWAYQQATDWHERHPPSFA